VSARTGYNIDQLKNLMRSMLFEAEKVKDEGKAAKKVEEERA
jgi:hypothetical protein